MKKEQLKPGNMLNPLPVVMVSCGTTEEEYNIITVAWCGTICTDPPMCYISIKPNRYSYNIIKKNKEFVINLTTEKLASITDWCGVRSGEQYNKFKEMNLTAGTASKIKTPIIMESPINLECVVKDIIKLGSHDMFIAEIVSVNINENLMSNETGSINFDDLNLLSFSHGNYYKLGRKIGKFGFSVQKKKKKNNRIDRNKH